MTKQVTHSTTAMQILAEDRMRTAYIIVNTDTLITVYVEEDPTCSSTTGMPLVAGQNLSKSNKLGDRAMGALWAVAASGTPVIAIMEEYGDA